MADQGRADHAAWDERALLQATLSSVGDAVIATDPTGNVAFLNPVAQGLTGWTHEEAAGQPLDRIFRIVNEGTRRPVENPATRALRDGTVVGLANHTVLIARDGTERPIEDSAAPIKDAAGRVGGCVLVFRDITERRKADRVVQDARAYAEAVVATVREPLVVLDGDLRVRTANRSFYGTFRVRPEDTEGQLLYDLGNRQWDIPALRKLLEDVLPQNTAFNDFSVVHEFPSIGRKVMLLNARRLYREGNHTELILLAVEDVTALREAERAQREAETRFTEMVKNVRDHSIFLTDPDGVITSWNVAAERIIGYAEAEAVGRHFSIIFTPEDVAAAVPEGELRQARDEGRAEDERWHMRKDGSRFWALGIVTPLHDAQGRLSGYSKVLRDMTEWKRADETSRDRQRQLEFVTDHAPVLLAQVDFDRHFRFVNVPYAERLGLHPRDIIGKHVRDVIGAEAYARIEPHVEAALRGERVEYEGDVPYAGIGTQTMRVAYEPERDEGGRVVGYVAAILNISDRKKAEVELTASRRRLQALFDTALDAILLADDQARYVDANPAACRLLGYGREELLQRGVFDITPLPNGEVGRAAWAAFVRAGHQAGEYALRRKDGSTAVMEYQAVANVQPGLHLSVLRDVTDRRRTEEALRASERRYKTLAGSAPVGIFETDAEGNCLFVNDHWCRMAGMTPDQARGQGWVAALHPEDKDRIFREWYAAAGGGREFTADYRFRTPEGRVTWLAGSAVALRDEGGTATGYIGTVTDITGLKRAEVALRESEGRLRAIIDNWPSVVFVKDREGRYLLANRACEPYAGEPAERMVGKTDYDYLPAEIADRFRADDRRVLETGEVLRYEEEAPLRGELRTSLTVKFPLADASGQAYAVCGIATDITDLKRAGEALRASRERLDLVVNSVDVGLWYCDLPFDKLIWNAKVKEHFGLPPDADVTIGTFYERLHPDDRERTRQAIERSIGDRSGYDVEYRTVGLDGRERWVRAIGRTFYGPAGQPVRFDGITVDVTERVRQEQALKEADRRKDEFLATLAHELRNPLAPLRNGLQVMKLAAGDAGAVEQARAMMDRQLGQMVHLIDDLLDVSRITRGKLQLRRERVDLATAVQSAVEGSRPLIEASAHRLTVALPPEPVWLDADPVRLAQVFSNLLTNAAKYTERAGHIGLTAVREGGEVVVVVRDTGIGIAAEHLPRLFEMFSQVSSALERSQGGLGIGLSLVKGLVAMHGGRVEARSEGSGKGSEFVVRLPVAGGSAPTGTRRLNGGETAAARPRRRVLVADDNRDAADSMAMMLRLGGHEVHAVHDGQEAVDAAGWFRPDLALLDIGMPRLNGFEACRRIREQPWGRSVTLVAITGWGQEGDKRRATEAGFDHHLTKPVDPAALERLLASSETPTRKGAGQ